MKKTKHENLANSLILKRDKFSFANFNFVFAENVSWLQANKFPFILSELGELKFGFTKISLIW